MITSEPLASPDYEHLCAGLEAPPAAVTCKWRELRIPASDGVALAATACEPALRPPRLAVVINSATAVPRGYYRHFAQYLAERGCAVLSYDYRGVGGSRDGGRGARMLDWGNADLAGALDWMLRRYPQLPLAAIGHSAGGWLFGLTPSNRAADALLTVGAQYPYWRHWPTLRGRLLMWSTMNLMIPAVTHACGRLPGGIFGSDSLPRGVALEWARWSRHPEFLTDRAGTPLREHFQGYRKPVRLLAIEDDDFAPVAAVQALAPLYGAEAQVGVIRPREHGLRRLGHFGFFRKSAPQALWDDALGWLQSQLGVALPAPGQ
jgi:predicted alpha/beta hydrolase